MPTDQHARSTVTYEGELKLVERRFYAGPYRNELWIEIYTSERSTKPVVKVMRLGQAWHVRTGSKEPALTPTGRTAKYQPNALGVRYQTRHEAIAAALEHARTHIARRFNRQPRTT